MFRGTALGCRGDKDKENSSLPRRHRTHNLFLSRRSLNRYASTNGMLLKGCSRVKGVAPEFLSVGCILIFQLHTYGSAGGPPAPSLSSEKCYGEWYIHTRLSRAMYLKQHLFIAISNSEKSIVSLVVHQQISKFWTPIGDWASL